MKYKMESFRRWMCTFLCVVLIILEEYECYNLNGVKDCKDRYLWLADGRVDCKYLIYPSKHGLHTKQRYYCTKYSLTNCCETCALVKRYDYVNLYDFPKTTDMQYGSETKTKIQQQHVRPKTIQLFPVTQPDNPVYVQVSETNPQTTTTPIPTQRSYSTVITSKQTQRPYEPVQVTKSSPTYKLPVRTVGQTTIKRFFTTPAKVKSTVAEMTSPTITRRREYTTEPPTKKSYTVQQTSSTDTVTKKPSSTGSAKRVCSDYGIWIASGSIPCDHLVKETKYGLSKNALYFCNKYPLTSCCETCEKINNYQNGQRTKPRQH